MMKKLILFSIILTFNVFALDRIWDTRYTNGPEIRGQSKMVLGAGLRTGKDTDFFVPVHFQGSVNEDAEFGAKLFYYSDNTHLNIGAKAYLSPNSYIGLDVPFMINKNFKGGLIVTYRDRKSTRLNSSHVRISYAVFCLKKKNNHEPPQIIGATYLFAARHSIVSVSPFPAFSP